MFGALGIGRGDIDEYPTPRKARQGVLSGRPAMKDPLPYLLVASCSSFVEMMKC